VKQAIITEGSIQIVELPVPMVQQGSYLVKVVNTSISKGTELAGIKASEVPLWQKVLKEPKKAINTLKERKFSVSEAIDFVKMTSSATFASGYSASGIIQEIGEGTSGNLKIGDRVACAGSQCAYHAEYICIPENLVVKIPDEVSFEDASTVTLGAIALQGIRRLQPTIGETFVVIGLGILGLLSLQILKANGCKVIGLDLDVDKIEIAKKLGADITLVADEDASSSIQDLTHGIGADGVLITASSSSSDVIANAFKFSRKKARVVIVGDIGLDLKRADFYEKEIDIYISSSYGPGRYDQNYEEGGFDYPVSYVRWTENRNMQAYISLLETKSINLTPLKSQTFSINEAQDAFHNLNNPANKGIIYLLSYYDQQDTPISRTIEYLKNNGVLSEHKEPVIKVALIGPGAFARSTLLPILHKSIDNIAIDTVVVREGFKSLEISKNFKINKVSTDYHAVLADPLIDTVIIATQHYLHAQMVLDALDAGKNIFVEKPLALSISELDSISNKISALQDAKACPKLMVGYNRRFSPAIKVISEITKKRTKPLIINYVMNAGFLPVTHWVQTSKGGGRNLGEACHIYDLFTFLTQSTVKSISASAIKSTSLSCLANDNFIATIVFRDGSICNLTYSAMGNSAYPKETATIFVDGKVIYMNDYQEVLVYENHHRKKIASRLKSKGHQEELDLFFNAPADDEQNTIPFWQMFQASKIALDIEEIISKPESN
jgi:predicted dehydrogenase/threonine dehydrogenase-like Zn-dependent dehydrogenase